MEGGREGQKEREIKGARTKKVLFKHSSERNISPHSPFAHTLSLAHSGHGVPYSRKNEGANERTRAYCYENPLGRRKKRHCQVSSAEHFLEVPRTFRTLIKSQMKCILFLARALFWKQATCRARIVSGSLFTHPGSLFPAVLQVGHEIRNICEGDQIISRLI